MIASQKFDLEAYLRERKQTVDSYLDRFLPPGDTYPEIIHEAMRYSIFAGGKRIRPILALATGEALGGDFHKVAHLACALEAIHTYSLIHDDLPSMDNDDYRRGVLTAHKKFGEGIAILAGDALLTFAFQLLTEIPGNSAETKLAVFHRICRCIGTHQGMIAGQVVDLMTEGQPFSRRELDFIHSAKTGALIHASVYCAALLSAASGEVSRQVGSFGSTVGLIFQIVDDILDIEGSPEQLGKSSGKDLQKQKATYPALYGLEKSREIVQELLQEALQKIAFLGPKGEVLKELAKFIAIRQF